MFDHFWSDQHFGHKNIISHCNRPFSDINQMTEMLIENYNSTVMPDEFVLWVGDAFFCGTQEAQRIMRALNGRKALVLGNHDKASAKMVSLGFDFVVKEMVIDILNTPCRISHYPYADHHDPERPDNRYLDRRPKKSDHEVLIHGHTHSKDKRNGRMIHVGVDAWDYFPAHCSEIIMLVREASRE